MIAGDGHQQRRAIPLRDSQASRGWNIGLAQYTEIERSVEQPVQLLEGCELMQAQQNIAMLVLETADDVRQDARKHRRCGITERDRSHLPRLGASCFDLGSFGKRNNVELMFLESTARLGLVARGGA